MLDLISGAAFSASQLTEAAPSCLIPPFGNIKNDDLGDKQMKFLVADVLCFSSGTRLM